MAPLDRERARLFADAKGTPHVDQFLKQIEAANLWHFARRPLDLDWLVRFWQSEGRLGSLAEMVERSVTERLKETKTDRARIDKLDSTSALKAAERIGAAMVFGRRSTIAIPDSEFEFSRDSPLDLADVLPDWSADDRTLLLSRPIFDPATLGRARFHNDNNEVVRGYLTARWLLRLRRANLSTGALFDLLFAKSYGLEVLKPSLNESTAWLTLWDRDVAHEVIRRSPSLLLVAGDPASLPSDVRRDALVSLMKELTTSSQELPLDNEMLSRFAQSDLGAVIQSLWPDYQGHVEAAQLLLRMVWLGALKDCAALAADAAFDSRLDSTTRIFAGRAFLATCHDDLKKNYAGLVMSERSTLPNKMVRDAFDELFPGFLSIQDLLAILESIDVTNDQGGLGFEWEGPRLVEKLDSPADLEPLLVGLFTQLGGEIGEHAHHPQTKREEAYFPAISAAALRLLRASPPDNAPEVAIEAVLRIGNRLDRGRELQAALNAARAELHRNSSRRRFAFWHVAERLRRTADHWLTIEHAWQMKMLGYPPGLQVEDIDWLLKDGLMKGEYECRLAINSALAIQQAAGAPVGLLETIRSAVSGNPVASYTFERWMQTRQHNDELSGVERELKEIERQNASQSAERDQSWIHFIGELRGDSARIAKLRIPARSDINPDLLSLWRLLDGANGRSLSRYAIDSVVPLEKIAGLEVAEAARDGLIAHWRNSAPLLRSQKDPKEWNSVRRVDQMGIVGVTLEATTRDRWAEHLSAHETALAAGYATLELNGFPRWLQELATAKPAEVRAVLLGEILAELSNPEITHFNTLSKVLQSEDGIAGIVAPALLADLEARVNLPVGALSRVLHVIVQGVPPQHVTRFVRLGIERFENASDVAVGVHYLAAVFSFDPGIATSTLMTKLAALNAEEQTALVDRFLALTFGDSMSSGVFKSGDVPVETLDQLVRLTFQTDGQAAARRRPAGVVYQVDDNDYAERARSERAASAQRARSAVFDRLARTPGPATFHALLSLQDDPACPITPVRLRAIAEERAVQDSESAPWPPTEAMAFEQHHETAPRTPKDLQSVLLRRLEDMQHDLLHGDFAQGLTLKALPDEVDVQNWVADRLCLKQGRSFSVEREPHVADEREPDVRVRAKSTDASVAMEIKVAKRWTLKQLEEALEVQLCGRYLRARDGRYGVLLLVYQNARQKGWKDKSTGVFLSFSEVVARLSARAALIAGAHHDCPQPEVCVIDVSSCKKKTAA